MQSVSKYYTLVFCLAFLCIGTPAQKVLSVKDQAAKADLEVRIQNYAKARAAIEAKLPKLPTKSTPEQIEAHKTRLQKAVLAARSGARLGDIITPAARSALRAMITTAYVGDDLKRLREMVFEAENKTVPVGVNQPYPEAEEVLEMPPLLLLTLPQLPKQLRWRFVARSLLLMDRETYLILDYMKDAIPPANAIGARKKR